MKPKIALYASLLTLGLAASEAVRAEPLLPVIGIPPREMPPYEAVLIARENGFEPLARPLRHRGVYSLRALDPDGQQVRLVVDARTGRIARVIPAPSPSYAMMPAPHSRPPGLVPDGYSIPPGAAPPSERLEAPAPARTAPSQSAPPLAAPPIPRARPKVAASRAPATAPATEPGPFQAPVREHGDPAAAAASAPAVQFEAQE